jgi:hypothetical protein
VAAFFASQTMRTAVGLTARPSPKSKVTHCGVDSTWRRLPTGLVTQLLLADASPSKAL